jgi:hypothetical protein
MPILSVGVRWGRAIGWVCKPEDTGSIPVRSTENQLETAGFSLSTLARPVGCSPLETDMETAALWLSPDAALQGPPEGRL